MEASPKAIGLIKQSESCRLQAYPDPAKGWAVPTIGWGSTGKDVVKGLVWTQAQCDARLSSHVQQISKELTAALTGAKTTQNQFDALIDFVYNFGIGKLQTSHLLTFHKSGQYASASNEFAKWNKADGKVMNGLIDRRAREKALYLT